MSSRHAVDNDVVIKLAAYDLLDLLQELFGSTSVLGSAKYVVRTRLGRKNVFDDGVAALGRFELFLAQAVELEPTEAELQLAATLEGLAITNGLPFDSGESQLVAVALMRTFDGVITGDKRAIGALEILLAHVPQLATMSTRIKCLEQVLIDMAGRIGWDELTRRIQSEPTADRAVFMCFRQPDQALQGLLSYIRDVRRSAPTLLANES